MAVRFLHSADWQIGKVFADLVDHDADKAALLKRERTAVVERLARLATLRQVDCVVVAGDVFDSQTVPEELLRRTLHAMAGFAGPWLLLPGNHDAALSESVWTRLLRLSVPGNVIPMLRPEPVLCADGRLAILPAPLAAAARVARCQCGAR
jgi:DNA repair exonuclease SbcCD nuclease subunit